MKTETQDKNIEKLFGLVNTYFSGGIMITEESTKARDEIYKLLTNEKDIADRSFSFLAQQPLSETSIKMIFNLGNLVAHFQGNSAHLSQRSKDMFYAVQQQFDINLRFQLPFNLWPELAKQSWIYMQDFINGKYKDLKEFNVKTQKHWEDMTLVLDKYENHPEYGDRIRARLTGYV